MHVIAAKAVAFKEALSPAFADYQLNVVKNAQAMAGRLLQKGLTLVSNGTDNHMMLVDLRNLNITGKEAEDVLGQAGITVNPESPLITSGIRIGTPALTTRGMQEAEMLTIAELIVDALNNRDREEALQRIRSMVGELCRAYPLYREFDGREI